MNDSLLSDAESRAITAENPTGEKGCGGLATEGNGAAAARELGPGWKGSPCRTVEPGGTLVSNPVAYGYPSEPFADVPPFPSRAALEIV